MLLDQANWPEVLDVFSTILLWDEDDICQVDIFFWFSRRSAQQMLWKLLTAAIYDVGFNCWPPFLEKDSCEAIVFWQLMRNSGRAGVVRSDYLLHITTR